MQHRLLLFLMFFALPTWAADTLVLGVFAYRPKEVLAQRFQPLADYLGSQLDDVRVELRVLKQDEIEAALAAKQLDLVFTNPSHYVVLRSQFKLTGALATLISEESGHAANQLGGVIIARADSDRIRSLADLKGRQIIVPGTKYLGGYQTQAFELLEAGVRLPQDARLKDVGTHDSVVKAILAGEGDAGFVRTGLIEQMVAEGKLDAARLRVLNRQDFPGFPYLVSTRLYPEWAFVALPQVDSLRVRKLAAALMSLEASHPVTRAAGISGFSPPHDYLPVENIMRALRSPPFDKVAPITMEDIWKQHRLTVQVLLASLILVSLLLVQLVRRNRQVEASRVAAEAANVAKSRFLSMMSHEIRTPMNGVLGMAQLLLQPKLDEAERLDYARTILNSGQTLLTLLNDILDLSKIEAGRFELEAGVVDPEQILRETAALFAGAAGEKGLTLTAAWQGEPRRYRGDPHRLRQMISNLVSNAIKFTEKGEVRFGAHQTGCAAGACTIEFSVSDTGIGIPADRIDRLFQPFSQVDASTTREFGGTGLGLSIVKSLARLMSGEVGIESQQGLGTRFWFRVQLEALANDADARKRLRDDAIIAPPASASRQLAGRILVVEDNRTNQLVVGALLKKLGLETHIVDNGQLAVERITTGDEHFDLILMDIQMPVLDGYGATTQIRTWEAEKGRAPLPIIALTADAFSEDQTHCREVGMNDYLSKPVNADALKATLTRWLGKA